MNAKLKKMTLIAILGIAATTSAFAMDHHGASQMHAQNMNRQSQASWQSTPLGYAEKGSPDRVVNIDSETRYLNVDRHEIIQINANGKSLTWKFDTFGTPNFSLSKIFPGVEGVTVYVSASNEEMS